MSEREVLYETVAWHEVQYGDYKLVEFDPEKTGDRTTNRIYLLEGSRKDILSFAPNGELCIYGTSETFKMDPELLLEFCMRFVRKFE